MVLGPRMQPLSERLGNENFMHEVTVQNNDGLHNVGRPYTISEEELITDYFDFLNSVKAVADNDSTEQGGKMLELAERFAHETTYMSVEDTRTAIRGLASSQIDYLTAEDDRHLLFYLPMRSAHRSQGKLVEDMMSYMRTSAPELDERIAVFGGSEHDTDTSLAGLDATKTKVVLLDDWSVTGSQLSNEIGHVQQYLQVNGLGFLKNDLEVNLLLSRADQIHDNFAQLEDVEETFGLSDRIPVRTYFTSRAVGVHAGPTPSGGHSTVDYGFKSRIEEMFQYVSKQTNDHDLQLPHMACVVRAEH